MVNLPKDQCCGCGACHNICPKGAILMCPDENGYVYPLINPEFCVDCGFCDKACPELTPPLLHEPKETLAAVCKDTVEFKSVASGGVATVISRHIIDRAGVVYGCRLKNYKEICHIRVDKLEDLDELKGSKYVHSYIGDTYKSVKKDLSRGTTVLFIGTPCQVGGLRQFLKKEYPCLLTIDLICHGVPSQEMLANEVQTELDLTKYDLEEVYVNFRWKMQFGVQFGVQYNVQGLGVVKQQKVPESSYMAAFLSGLSYRDNCHKCQYACKARVGDLTVGDFWGLGFEVPSKMNCSKGVSVILVNSDAGMRLMNEVVDLFEVEHHTFDEAAHRNWNLHAPSLRPQNKDEFLRLYREKGIKAATLACDESFRHDNTFNQRFKRRCFEQALRFKATHILGRQILKIYRKLQ